MTIGNPDFGNIDNLISQGCDMEYIVRHSTSSKRPIPIAL